MYITYIYYSKKKLYHVRKSKCETEFQRMSGNKHCEKKVS